MTDVGVEKILEDYATLVEEKYERSEARRSTWLGILALVIMLLAVVVPANSLQEPVRLLKALALSAGLIATMAAVVRLAAHEGRRSTDFFGKLLGFMAALLALMTAVAAFLFLPLDDAPAKPSPTPVACETSLEGAASIDSTNPCESEALGQLLEQRVTSLTVSAPQRLATGPSRRLGRSCLRGCGA